MFRIELGLEVLDIAFDDFELSICIAFSLRYARNSNNRRRNIKIQQIHLLSALMIAQRRAGGKEREKNVEEKEKCCLTCMHEALPQGIDPCSKCLCHDEWKPKDAEPMVGIDPGAPEGDKTNVRFDRGERGPELIGPVDITSVDQLKDGPLLETARAIVKRIERLDYAIEGVRSKMSSISLKFTDKALSRDELSLLVGQLNALQADLFELEEEREALINGGKCPSREIIE